MEKIIFWGIIDLVVLSAIFLTLIRMIVRKLYQLFRYNESLEHKYQGDPSCDCAYCNGSGCHTGPVGPRMCYWCNGSGYVPLNNVVSAPPQSGSGVPDRPIAPDPMPKPSDKCNHDHSEWRLDLTKEITHFHKSKDGPSAYKMARIQFISAFEIDDMVGMEQANEKLKAIELNNGIKNDVDIIERLMQMKGVQPVPR